jgi:hypothetical protein
MQEYAVALQGINQASTLGSCLFELAQLQKFFEDAITDLVSHC